MAKNRDIEKWRCEGCGRVLGIISSDKRYIEIESANHQTILMSGGVFNGICKCGTINKIPNDIDISESKSDYFEKRT